MKRKLSAEIREKTGTGSCKRLRRQGQIPAVVYGRDVESTNLVLDKLEIRELLREGAMKNVLLELDVESEDEPRDVLIKDADIHPVSSNLLHVDLQQVSPEHRVKVEVPIKLVGTSVGVERDNGILDQPLRSLRIGCKASDLPPQIEIQIEELEIGDAVYVEDLDVPDEVDVLTPGDRVVVSVQPPEEFDLEVEPAAGVEAVEETVEEALEEAEEVEELEEAEEGEAEEGEEAGEESAEDAATTG